LIFRETHPRCPADSVLRTGLICFTRLPPIRQSYVQSSFSCYPTWHEKSPWKSKYSW
jgi:hypothetical protein